MGPFFCGLQFAWWSQPQCETLDSDGENIKHNTCVTSSVIGSSVAVWRILPEIVDLVRERLAADRIAVSRWEVFYEHHSKYFTDSKRQNIWWQTGMFGRNGICTTMHGCGKPTMSNRQGLRSIKYDCIWSLTNHKTGRALPATPLHVFLSKIHWTITNQPHYQFSSDSKFIWIWSTWSVYSKLFIEHRSQFQN